MRFERLFFTKRHARDFLLARGVEAFQAASEVEKQDNGHPALFFGTRFEKQAFPRRNGLILYGFKGPVHFVD
jgi:hypothetical protein